MQLTYYYCLRILSKDETNIDGLQTVIVNELSRTGNYDEVSIIIE